MKIRTDDEIVSAEQWVRDVKAACVLASCADRAEKFIAQGVSVTRVIATLRAKQQKANPDAEISLAFSQERDPAVTSSWDRHIEAHNARVDGKMVVTPSLPPKA